MRTLLLDSMTSPVPCELGTMKAQSVDLAVADTALRFCGKRAPLWDAANKTHGEAAVPCMFAAMRRLRRTTVPKQLVSMPKTCLESATAIRSIPFPGDGATESNVACPLEVPPRKPRKSLLRAIEERTHQSNRRAQTERRAELQSYLETTTEEEEEEEPTGCRG